MNTGIYSDNRNIQLTRRNRKIEVRDLNKKDLSQTLLRGLQVLDIMGRHQNGVTVKEVSEEIGLPRSIIYRLIYTLEMAKYVRKDDTTLRHSLGIKLWEMGCAAVRRLGIREIARPHLEELAAKSQEMVHVAVLDGYDVVYLDKIHCPQPVRAYTPMGGRAPSFFVATGKAILAYLPSSQMTSVLSSMKKFKKNAPTDAGLLVRQLNEVRRRGYAVSLGEWREELGGVASPIHNEEGRVVASIGITVPIMRLPDEKIPHLGRLCVAAAIEVSAKLGYQQTVQPLTYLVKE